ncbi:MAG: hypothetical protein H9W81_08020 [Enterococcus sp.]|nr:hypothetical protein [Enterococcus sp.]
MVTIEEITRKLNSYFPALELATKRITNIIGEGCLLDERYIEELSNANDDATAADTLLTIIKTSTDRDQIIKGVQREFNYSFSREDRNIRATKIYNEVLLSLLPLRTKV